MSYFSGCSHDSYVIIVDVMLLLLLLLCSFGTSHQASLGGVGHDEYYNHHLNLFGSSSSSRDEVVQMAGYGEEKLSTVLITGSLSCQLAPARRFHNNIIIGDHHHHHHQSHAWPISGALVGVNCHGYEQERKGSKSLVAEGVTDEFGDFMVDLPSHLHAIPNLEKICRVEVRGIPKGSLCRPPAAQRDVKGGGGGGGGLININLSSVGNGIRTYDAGNIRILHHSTSEPSVVVVLHRPPPPKYGGRRHL